MEIPIGCYLTSEVRSKPHKRRNPSAVAVLIQKLLHSLLLPRNTTFHPFYVCMSSVIAGSTRKNEIHRVKEPHTGDLGATFHLLLISDQSRLAAVSTDRFSVAVPRWMQAHQTLVLNCFAQASSTKVARLAPQLPGKAVEAVAEPFPMQPAPRLVPTTSAGCLN
jgi:hypothetical protein